MHLVIKSYIRRDEKQRKNLRRENIRIISHYVLTRWKENKTFRSPFFFPFFSWVENWPCVAWMARKGKYSSFNGYFLYFKLAWNVSTTGYTDYYFKDLELAHWLLLPQTISKKWFNFPSQWCVQIAHTPLTPHSRNVWIPTFLISYSSRRIFFQSLKEMNQICKRICVNMPKKKWKSDAFKGRAWSALLRCSVSFAAFCH